MMRAFLCIGAALFLLAGCATKQPFADATEIAAVSYRNPGPATLTLYTMVNNRSGSGAHSSLMINASQRVIFDPAGPFYLSIVPERNDVLFGITPQVEAAYRGAHARSTFHVVHQTIEVTPEQAETAYQLALNNGAVAGAFCSNATSNLLRQVPGFESLRSTMSPTRLAEEFGKIPGVRTEYYYEDDSPDLQAALKQANTTLAQRGY